MLLQLLNVLTKFIGNLLLSMFSLLFWLNPIRIDGVAEGFDDELAHKAKHTETTSETKSQPKQKCYMCFCKNETLVSASDPQKRILYLVDS